MLATYSPLLTGAGATALGVLVGTYVLAGLVEIAAVISIVRVPSLYWPHRMWSKLGWICVALWFTIHLWLVALPAGAAIAIWQARRAARFNLPGPPDLPFADGAPSSPGPSPTGAGAEPQERA
ncbi:MAG: hypothetical protein ACYC1D_01065 [Acidimicrobiales bacterium]